MIACLSLACGCGGGNQLPVTEAKDPGPGVLTRERAQRTLDAWQADSPNTSVRIERGVVEYLAFSTAEAEVAITSVRYKDGETVKTFSGKGMRDSESTPTAGGSSPSNAFCQAERSRLMAKGPRSSNRS